jgi:hypothetical protein
LRSKHIIETTSEINDLKTWRTQNKKYKELDITKHKDTEFKELDIILFAKVHPDGKTRTGDYAKYLVMGRKKDYVILNKVK